MHAGLTEGFDGSEEACSAGRAAGSAVLLFDLIAGGAVPDTALMQMSEGVAVPEMLNGQLTHEGINGRRTRKRGCTM